MLFCRGQAELLAWLTGSPWTGLYLRSQHPPLPHPERRYAGAFQASAAFDHAWALGLTPAEQRERCRELARQDYRPAALSAAAMDRNAALTASIWHRPVTLDDAKERLAKRQANAATALLRLGRTERVWPLLRHRPDPRLRSYLIHRLSPLGADPRALARRLDTEPDLSIRRALLLSLGEFGPELLPVAEREAMIPGLLRMYREEPDAGLHGAAEWVLRPLLVRANLILEVLRFQVRLAKDLQCLKVNSYGHAAKALDEIGQLVGGWIKSGTKP